MSHTNNKEYRHKKLSKEYNNIISDFQKNLPDAPVDVVALAEKFECSVIYSKLPPEMSGAIKKDGANKYLIFVNEIESDERKRFTVAHELAHCLIHSDHLDDGLRENIMFRSKLSNTLETEANKIAADILMPEEKLNEFIESRKYGFNKLAEIFGVSRAAILVRLGIPEHPSRIHRI